MVTKTQSELLEIPNVGPAMVRDFEKLGITKQSQLRGKKAINLYDKLCEITKTRHDPCVLDTFMAAVHYVDTGEERTWWSFTKERKSKYPDV